jgi:2,4-dienoyl-CoA reductase (NADPH2)
MVATPPGKKEFHNLITYFEAMLRKNDVKTVLGKAATSAEISDGGFDIVVTATGMIPNMIKLPGESKIPVYSAYDVLQGKVIPGKDIVIVGGGSVGCETAQYMAHDASASPEQVYFLLEHEAETVEKVLALLHSNLRNISIVDIVKIGAGFDPGTGWPVMKDLKRLGIKQYPFSKITTINDSAVTISVHDKGTEVDSIVEIPCDTIVLSVGAKPNNALFSELKELGVNVANLGDSDQIGKVIDAIHKADELAYKM